MVHWCSSQSIYTKGHAPHIIISTMLNAIITSRYIMSFVPFLVHVIFTSLFSHNLYNVPLDLSIAIYHNNYSCP